MLGDSFVKIFDARRARLNQYDGDMVGTQGIRLHLLPAGEQFEPKRGRATLPGG